MSQATHTTDVVVIGGGPAGYTAAFLASYRGKSVTLVDEAPRPVGVCLYRGCMPSKALLHAAKVVNEGELPARVMVCFNASGQAGAGMAEECAVQLSNQLTSADVLGVMQLPHSGDSDRSSGLRSTAERFFESTAFNGGMIDVKTAHSWQRQTA